MTYSQTALTENIKYRLPLFVIIVCFRQKWESIFNIFLLAWIIFRRAPCNIGLVISALALISSLFAWTDTDVVILPAPFNLYVALLCLGLDRGLRRCFQWASQGLRAMSCVDQRRWRQRPPSGPSPLPTLSTARCMWFMSWANLQPRWWLMHAEKVNVGFVAICCLNRAMLRLMLFFFFFKWYSVFPFDFVFFFVSWWKIVNPGLAQKNYPWSFNLQIVTFAECKDNFALAQVLFFLSLYRACGVWWAHCSWIGHRWNSLLEQRVGPCCWLCYGSSPQTWPQHPWLPHGPTGKVGAFKIQPS